MFGSTQPPVTQPFGLQDQMTSNQTQAVPLAYVAGTRIVAAKWFTPIYNLRVAPAPSASGGKGGKGGGTQNTYYGTIAGAICRGLVTDLVAILMNGSEVYPGGTPWAVGLIYASGGLYVFDAQTWTCPVALNGVAASAANAPGTAGWTEYTFNRGAADYSNFTITDSSGQVYGDMTLYWGTPTQTVDPLLESTGNDAQDAHPDYKNICYVVLRDFLLGQDVQSGPNLQLVVRRAPQQTVVTGGPAGLTDGQCNLAAAAVEVLTSPLGVGVDSSVVDATSFNAVATWLNTKQALCAASVLLDTSKTLRAFFDEITQMMDGYSRYNPTTKCIELGVFQHGVVPVDYAWLTTDDLAAVPKFTGSSWQEARSRATVNFPSRQLAYQTSSTKADDPRIYTVLGQVREVALDRPYICRPDQALAHGTETLRVVGRPPATAEIQVRREFGRTIRAGSYVFIDVDIEPGVLTVQQFFRVTSRQIPSTGPITLKLLAENTLAMVPWNNAAPTKIPVSQAVPAVASFRVLEVPTVLSGERGAIIALVERPSNIVVGCGLYFDTDPAGTFPLLGTFTGFAAAAVLSTAVAATDATINITAAAQPDSGYLTNSYTAVDQANDTLLAILVSVVPSGGDAGEVAETGGYQIIEICSVGAIALAAGVYTLTVLRGRQNTTATAFTVAHTEVWLIPRAFVSAFSHQKFDQIRANRLAGLTPAYAQFRFCPYTFVATYPLASAANEQFRFPLNSASAPSLTLTAPASFAPNYSGVSTWPLGITLTGLWSDPDGNLVEAKVLLRKSTDTTDRMVSDQTFSPCFSFAIQGYVQIEQPGSYIVKLIARDATNLVTERDIAVTVAGTSSPKCALPSFLDANGNPILNGFDNQGNPIADGSAPVNSAAKRRFGVLNGGAQVYYWSVKSRQPLPVGQITLTCPTPGATIYFITTGVVLQAGDLLKSGAKFTYAPNLTPYNVLNTTFTFEVDCYASAAGYADSDIITLSITQAY